MLLMCQIDLAATASAMEGVLPAEGGLLFFVAGDDEGEVLVDELFNPVAWHVLWTQALTPQPLPLPDGAPTQTAARALRLVADATQWPQPDAPIVQAQGWNADRLEAFRQFMDQHLPEGPAPGHRLGGYPTVVQHNDLDLDAAIADGRSTKPAE